MMTSNNNNNKKKKKEEGKNAAFAIRLSKARLFTFQSLTVSHNGQVQKQLKGHRVLFTSLRRSLLAQQKEMGGRERKKEKGMS